MYACMSGFVNQTQPRLDEVEHIGRVASTNVMIEAIKMSIIITIVIRLEVSCRCELDLSRSGRPEPKSHAFYDKGEA